MIPPIIFIIEVLKGNIIVDGDIIPLVKEVYPIDKTPCITVDDSGGTALVSKSLIHQPKEFMVDKRSTSININVYANTDKIRYNINEQIRTLFKQVQSDHYKFCSNYNEGECSYLEDTCAALNHIQKREYNMRSSKSQCPYPKAYGYENLFTKYHIIRDTFDVAPSFDLDDLTVNQPVFHSVIKLTCTYYDLHYIGGLIAKNLNIDEDLL